MSYSQSPFINKLVEAQILANNQLLVKEIIPWLSQTPKITTFRVNLLKTSRKELKEKIYETFSRKFQTAPSIWEPTEFPEVLGFGSMEDNFESIAEIKDLKEVIVDTSCASALLRGADIFAPGVLGMMSGTQKNDQVKVYADLTKKCKRGLKTPLESLEKTFIGIGIVRMDRYEIYGPDSAKTGIAVEMQWTISKVPSFGKICNEEMALLQNLPSIIAVRVLSPQKYETILDMCSAPGNKTTHIAEMMGDEGIIVALDKSSNKIKEFQKKLEAHNFKSIKPYAFDSTKSFDKMKPPGEFASCEPPFAANSFDRILLDAPCSALGNRPLLRSSMDVNLLSSFPRVQKHLFDNAVHLLKTNGVLVYSTCTITEAENEEMVSWVLNKYPQLQLVTAEPRLGGPGLPNNGLNNQQMDLVQRFGPSHTNLDKSIDTVGFFIAKFVKTA